MTVILDYTCRAILTGSCPAVFAQPQNVLIVRLLVVQAELSALALLSLCSLHGMHGPEHDAGARALGLGFLIFLQCMVASLLCVDPGSRSSTPNENRDTSRQLEMTAPSLLMSLIHLTTSSSFFLHCMHVLTYTGF